VSKRKSRRKRRSTSQIIFIAMSALLAISMMASLIIVALPGPSLPTPTPWPTPTAIIRPTATPVPVEPSPTTAPTLEPTAEPTEPVVGPELPTATPTLTPTITATPVSAAPTRGEPELVFSVCGDSRDDPRAYRRVLEAVMADGSEFLINTGDLVNRGTETQWREFQEVMAGFTLPFYPVPGNHDGLVGSLDGYLAYSGAPAAHYSFDRGLVHFTMADSHHGGISSAELAWLRDDLRRSQQPVKMVFLHHPPFDPDGTDHIMAFGNEPFMGLMIEQDVGYVFAGHIHAYAQQERDGVLYIITGGAGAPLYGTQHSQSFHHYVRIAVQGLDVAIQVVRV
jgi:hypothetical protein